MVSETYVRVVLKGAKYEAESGRTDSVFFSLERFASYIAPSKRSWEKLRNLLEDKQPLAHEEAEFIQWIDELRSPTASVSFEDPLRSLHRRFADKLPRVS